jgi:hypothetical protein
MGLIGETKGEYFAETQPMINTSQKNRDTFSSVKEQALNFMWDGINWGKKRGGVNILLKHNRCIPIFLRLRCVYHRSIMKTNNYPCYILI